MSILKMNMNADDNAKKILEEILFNAIYSKYFREHVWRELVSKYYDKHKESLTPKGYQDLLEIIGSKQVKDMAKKRYADDLAEEICKLIDVDEIIERAIKAFE